MAVLSIFLVLSMSSVPSQAEGELLYLLKHVMILELFQGCSELVIIKHKCFQLDGGFLYPPNLASIVGLHLITVVCVNDKWLHEIDYSFISAVG